MSFPKNRWVPVLTVLFVLLFCADMFAQNRMPSIDFNEFRKSLSSAGSPDEKIQQYLDMSMKAARVYPDSLKKLARELQQLEGLDAAKREGYTNFIMTYAWLSTNQDSAIYYGERALDKLKDAKTGREYIFTANLLGGEYNRKREYLKADSVLSEAIRFSETEYEGKTETNFLYGNLGSLYSMVGLHDKAIELFKTFLSREDSPGNRCNTISKLALSLMEIYEYEQAVDQLTTCLEYPGLPPPIQAMIRSNLGSIYKKMGKDEPAVELLEEAASISYKHNIPNIKVTNLINLGKSYLDTGEIQKADSIRGLLEGIPNKHYRPNFRIDASVFFAELFLNKKEYRAAIGEADKAISVARENNLQHLLKNSYQIKSRAYEHLGELNKAIEFSRTQRNLDVLLRDKTAERNIAMMQVRYQLMDKERELDQVTQQLGTVRVTTAIIIFFVLIAGLYATYRIRMYFLLKEEKTRNEIAGGLHDEVSATLSSISFFAEAITRNDPAQKKNKFVNLIQESAGEAKEKITDIVWAINPEQDSWNSLLTKCHRFAADLFESKGISYQITISEEFFGKPDMEVKQNLWLIFKEMITNSVRHASANHVKIEAKETSGSLVLTIEDDGKGFDMSKNKKGYGLKSIFQRGEKIEADITIHSEEGNGTSWQIRLPL